MSCEASVIVIDCVVWRCVSERAVVKNRTFVILYHKKYTYTTTVYIHRLAITSLIVAWRDYYTVVLYTRKCPCILHVFLIYLFMYVLIYV
jgi:hypothetical protein